jgi:hypothetical protein
MARLPGALVVTLTVAASAWGNVDPIPAEPPIGGIGWSVVVPALLFVTALAATWSLYRRFAGSNDA